jgi:hypothetical protein
VTIVNLSEGGIGLRIDGHQELGSVALSAGDEVGLRLALPETEEMPHTIGRVIWTTAHLCGIRFSHVPDDERTALEQWMRVCVERSLAEVCERVGLRVI